MHNVRCKWITECITIILILLCARYISTNLYFTSITSITFRCIKVWKVTMRAWKWCDRYLLLTCILQCSNCITHTTNKITLFHNASRHLRRVNTFDIHTCCSFRTWLLCLQYECLHVLILAHTTHKCMQINSFDIAITSRCIC